MNKVPRIAHVIVTYDSLLRRYAKRLTADTSISEKLMRDVFEAWYDLPDALKQGDVKEQLRRLTFAVCQAYNQIQTNSTSEISV